jgi:predicted phosphodiesterase
VKIFTISDIHIDYEENRHWFYNLSQDEYKDDILILAGDITDETPLLEEGFRFLTKCFREVLYVPGNHDLWTFRENGMNSLEKYELISTIAKKNNIRIEPLEIGPLSIVPLLGWYDYSFGPPSDQLKSQWTDYRACTWPEDFDEKKVTRHFISLNERFLAIKNRFIISFSHFLPRLDIMPFYIPKSKRYVYPALGTHMLELQIRQLCPQIHIYGHSHVNMHIQKDNITYINNAFGYPYEKWTTSKQLHCVFDYRSIQT